jgi:integrase
MPLRIIRRKSTGALTISGTVAGQRIQRRAQSNDSKLAAEEAAVLEAQLLRTDWHGERRGARSFAAAVIAYFEAEPRTDATKKRYNRVLLALGDVKLSEIDQDAITALRHRMMRPGHSPSTVTREIINPMRAIMRFAAKRKWCDLPDFEVPREIEGRTLYLTPNEAERLIAAAPPHLKSMLIFLIGTGARMGETVYLNWDDRSVDLIGRRVIFFADQTKAKKRRIAELPPRVVVELANLHHRDGPVFRRPDGRPYEDRRGKYGGQIKTAFAAAVRRAGLNPELTPHSCRHTWATWHYALNKDPMKLKVDGGWSSLDLVERYAHLMPEGHQAEICRFLGLRGQSVTSVDVPSATS